MITKEIILSALYRRLYIDFDKDNNAFIDGFSETAELILSMINGDDANLRKSYFAFRDRFHMEGQSGLSKVEIHELAKKYIFPKLIENPDNFTDKGKDQSELSVTWLSEQGWKSFIEEFKLFCAENYNFYL